MIADTKPAWIEEAEHAACIAVAEELKHTQWSGAIVLAALRAFMKHVPIHHRFVRPDSDTLRLLKSHFTEKPDA